MDLELLQQQVERGATVLTASRRLARELVGSYTVFQRDRGRSVWPTPRILSWDGFLQRWSGALSCAVLNPAQEAALWEDIIWQSPAGRTLLRVPETARCAMDAWKLLQAYRLPFPSAAFETSEDTEAFAGWAAEFERRTDERGWLESARLSDHIACQVRAGALDRPYPLILAGFDELTPQDQDLLDALCGATRWTPPEYQTNPSAAAFRDTEAEIRGAAAWSRQILETNPSARVAVVVPDIGSVRRKLERIFADALRTEAAFHLSLGQPLARYPVIDAALRVISLASGARPLEELGLFLRSPFLKDAGTERSVRALLDAKLRRECAAEATLEELRSGAERLCPSLYRMLGPLDKEFRKLPPEENPSQWSRSFSRLLKIAGWPGPRTLTSAEHQTVTSWNNLLSTFASLDSVSGRLSLDGALARLRNLAMQTKFQTENLGAPVEIIGLLEASGLHFDHTWVMGLHDAAMPAPARPNPFLPLSLQRELNMPHCSAARELEFGRKLLDRLAGSARQVVFSYPEWEGDQPLGRSPLVPAPVAAFFQSPEWYAIPPARLEECEDATAPPVPEGGEQRGGASTFKDMAACPFRAYATHRLGARALEDPELGVNPRERGDGVHQALEHFWREVQSHQALCGLSQEDLRTTVGRAVEAAIQEPDGLGWTLERKRLERILGEWLEVEKRRPPFTVVEFEAQRETSVGGLQVRTRIDRVDVVEGGGRILIDYKTGDVHASAWTGERMDEPQVPLYCVGEPGAVVAAAFGQVRTGELQFLGVSESREMGPAMKSIGPERGRRMADRMDEWDRALTTLAKDFRAGVARVDPKSGKSCEYCKLKAVCRVTEGSDD